MRRILLVVVVMVLVGYAGSTWGSCPFLGDCQKIEAQPGGDEGTYYGAQQFGLEFAEVKFGGVTSSGIMRGQEFWLDLTGNWPTEIAVVFELKFTQYSSDWGFEEVLVERGLFSLSCPQSEYTTCSGKPFDPDSPPIKARILKCPSGKRCVADISARVEAPRQG